jgi:hypothetical protein
MRSKTTMMFIAIVFALAACPLDMQAQSPGKPDLVVTSFRLTGTPRVADGSVRVPVAVTIRNQGAISAPVFKVATEYRKAGGPTYAVAFAVAGESTMWYPFTDAALAPGRSAVFSGDVVFTPGERRTRVTIWANADSCSGDEFMPKACRVDEVNELNNRSVALTVRLP